MAAIIQADLYQTLSRKIGYSVGLEELIDRVLKLVALYVTDRGLSFAAFSHLVEVGFGRRKAVEHFANFYGTINLVRFIGRRGYGIPQGRSHKSAHGRIEPLYQLDSLAILHRLLGSDDAKYRTAVESVLTQCLVEADGDIFLNGLLSDFNKAGFRRLLEQMVDEKDNRLEQAFRNPAVLANVRRHVYIKNQGLHRRRGNLLVPPIPQVVRKADEAPERGQANR